MGIHVYNEIAPLKRVLLHRPGKELEHLSPATLAPLLFDDIPYLEMARHEHDYFADILTRRGAEVVYLENLMADTLAQNPDLRYDFVDCFIAEGGDIAVHYKHELRELLLDIEDNRELVLKTMAGVNINEMPPGARGALVSLVRPDTHFVLDPIPNLYFTRDPFSCIGKGVAVGHMHSKTRQRETIYARYIFDHHAGYRNMVKSYYRPDLPFPIEGGDVLVLSERVLAVGISQRTSAAAIELLAQNVFRDEESKFDTLLAIDIPNVRAFMHLDTVFTQVDRDKFTVHSAAVAQSMGSFKLRKNGIGSFTVDSSREPIKKLLEDTLDVGQVTLIPCGGDDFIASEREQWNDGANTLCISPGMVVVYNRNSVTNRLLREAGVTVLEMPSSELSRGRGGPRCMSMPLERR